MKAFLNSKKLSLSLFFIYLFILTWVIVAKMDWSLLKSSNLSWLHNPKLLLHPGVTWKSINLVNLKDYIEPTRNRAELILHKAHNHEIDEIYLKK